MDYREDSPEILLDFLSYHETIKAHSQRTVDEYYLDLRNFFRYLKWTRDPALQEQCKHSYELKAAGEVLPYNYDYAFYSSETKNIYSVDIKSGVTEIVIGTGDVDEAWQKFIDDNRGMWEPLLNELNAEYFGG